MGQNKFETLLEGTHLKIKENVLMQCISIQIMQGVTVYVQRFRPAFINAFE